MKKILTLAFALTMIITFSNSQIKANETPETPKEIAERLNKKNEINTIVDNGSVFLGDNEVKLYVTFEDSDYAMNKVKKEYENVLNYIQREYALDELNESNVKNYLNIMESENDLHISQKEKESMILFLDIYQNTGLNETIIKNSDSYKISPKEEYKEAIDVVSPLYNESISKIFKAGNSNLRSLSLPNLNAAIRYADNYARNANPLYANYDSSGGDCTNFVSQILNAGGIGQVDTGNENTGWWYRSRNNRSISWINAQTFARYMGISGTARSFTALHSIAHVGAFIGGSTSNDGKLNHLAFVTDKNAKDLRIAQHSAFYHEWTYAGASGWKSGSSYWMIR